MTKIRKILITLCVICIVLGFSACGQKIPPNIDNPKVTLSKETIEMNLFEKQNISYSLTSLDGDAVWTVSNSEIIVVIDGEIWAVGVGKATVTIKVGEYSDSCEVTVQRGILTPEFDALPDTLKVVKNSSYPLDLSMSLNGDVFELATISCTTEGDILTIDENGVITAKEYGKQNVTITATYKDGVVVTKIVKVEVYELGVIKTGLSGNKLVLFATNIDGDKTTQYSFENFQAQLNGEDYETQITCTSSDENIVEISDGKLIAKKPGKADITASFTTLENNTYDAIISVTVEKESIARDFSYSLVESGKTTLDLAEFTENITNVEKVTVNSKEVGCSTSGNSLNLTGIEDSGKCEIIVCSETVDYLINITLAERVLTTDQDVLNYFAAYDGKYTVLANDIDMGGSIVVMANYWGYAPKLDGLGHTLANFSTSVGIFGTTEAGALIRNIQFVNITKIGADNKAIGFFGKYYGGLIENVLLIGKWDGAVADGQSILYGDKSGMATTFSNVVINVEMPKDFYFALSPEVTWASPSDYIFDSVYFVGSRIGSQLVDIADEVYFALPTQFTSANGITISNIQLSNEWTVEDGKLPYISEYSKYLGAEKLTYSSGYEVINSGSITIDFTKLSKTISGIKKIALGGVDITSSLSGNNLVLSDTTAGEKVVKIYTDAAIYEFKVAFAERVLTTKQNVLDYFAAYDGKYTVLANDIDMGGSIVAMANYWGYAPKLDGLGHTLANFSTSVGIFGTTEAGALIRNIQFVNITKIGADNKAIGFFGKYYGGLIENVLLIGKWDGAVADGQSILYGDKSGMATTFSNVVINVEMPKDFYFALSPEVTWASPSDYVFDNVYFVGSRVGTQLVDTADNVYFPLPTVQFTSASEITTSNVQLSDAWTVENGKLPQLNDYSQYVSN